jgi:CSLREA domain-containing protein
MPSRGRWLAAVLVLIGPGGGDAQATSPQAGVFVVTTTEDTEDLQWGDNACGDSLGRCSLRGALQEANAHEGADTIRFRVGTGPQTIKPASALPVVFDETVIDGTTQPGYAGAPLIRLDGAEAGTGADGIVLADSTSVVKGLAITGFDGIGVVITDGEASRVEASYIGVAPDGRTHAGNRGHGVHLLRARNAVVGGYELALRNVIAGNGGNGVYVAEVGSRGNRVVGNFIGLDATGALPLPNRVDGVSIENAPHNTVGGTEAGAVNMISGNLDDGVEIVGPGAYSNTVQANWLGTAVDGRAAVGNGDAAVLVAGSTDNSVIGNVMAASGGFGLELGAGARANRIVANYVGTNPDGVSGLGNGTGGIGIRDGAANVVGETGLPNIVAGNRGPGVLITGARARANEVRANAIGGSAAESLPNAGFGVVIRDGASANTVAGNTAWDGMRVWTPGTDFNLLEANTVISAGTLEGLEIGIEVGYGARNTVLRGNAVRDTKQNGILVAGFGTTGTVVEGGSVANTGGAGIRVLDDAAATALRRSDDEALRVVGAGGPAVELWGDGHSVAGVEMADSGAGVHVHGNGHALTGVVTSGMAGAAVAVLDGSGHQVRGLETDGAGGLPIDLGGDGHTANDALDTDAGPNGLQNYPLVLRAQVTASSADAVTVLAEVALESRPDRSFEVEFYAVEGCARGTPSRFVGGPSTTVRTGPDGRSERAVPGLSLPGTADGLAALATDEDGSSSELSPCEPLVRGRVHLPALHRSSGALLAGQ